MPYLDSRILDKTTPYTVIFQAGKLGNRDMILNDLAHANRLYAQGVLIRRIYGVSGGSLAAVALAMALASRSGDKKWEGLRNAISDFSVLIEKSRKTNFQSLSLNPFYGFHQLNPLRKWIINYLNKKIGNSHPKVSDFPVPLYLCVIDQDAIFTLFGLENKELQYDYQFVKVGPPQDAPLVDALIASLSTILSTDSALVNNHWYRDCRPSVADAGAIILDLEKNEPKRLLRSQPITRILPWKTNWFTSSFIMHSFSERNQTILARYYLDLVEKHQKLLSISEHLPINPLTSINQATTYSTIKPLRVGHVDLPYIGSTEAYTNMRQSVENKATLMNRFQELLDGQLDDFPFDEPANIIYGAGGFSGILAGLVTTRAINTGFSNGRGKISQIYGVSAGVLNGFFHAVQVAAFRHPDLYHEPAQNALADLEQWIATVEPKKVTRINKNPSHFWKGWANLNPLAEYLKERLAAYTGSSHPEQLTFDDINLPMTIMVAPTNGIPVFLGMEKIDRQMNFSGQSIKVHNTSIITAIIAGWSMNTYIIPTMIDGVEYQDGGGTFYDPGLLIACLDPEIINLLNVHLDEPEGHSYNLPARPNLARILFDTHNLTFPEERRRMRILVNLLYEHFRLRTKINALIQGNPDFQIAGEPIKLPVDFRRAWDVE